ncbi:MAG: hypothetical protein CVT90_00420 [Candidatus Altiarchaeales archaeon HGW-Altiarchaeales-3]|nr:MAG: hypothetical protein CVT90_00420 [Candidatus Altiarchaeales archaeon HGW-Altiarchaeales-3]
MARYKIPGLKTILIKENRTRKSAPNWVFQKTGRKVKGSPQSNRHWRRNSIF